MQADLFVQYVEARAWDLEGPPVGGRFPRRILLLPDHRAVVLFDRGKPAGFRSFRCALKQTRAQPMAGPFRVRVPVGR